MEHLTVAQALDKLKNKEVSSRELTEAALNRIDRLDDTVKAFMTVTRDEAITAAATIDAKRMNNEKLGPLAGVPMAFKDNMCTKGVRTTCSSKILHNFIPPDRKSVV